MSSSGLAAIGRSQEAQDLIAQVSEHLKLEISRSEAVSILDTDLFRTVTDSELDTGELSAESLEFVATQLAKFGVVALSPVLPLETISNLHRGAEENLACVERALGERGELQNASYREVVVRGAGRFDLQYGMDRPPFNDPQLLENPLWSGILRNVLGSDFRCFFTGLVTTKPGARDQGIHTDGPPLFGAWSWHLPAHCCNVFVPLVDLTRENGATLFFPGSHWDGNGHGSVAGDVPAGSIVVFDYRLAHQGRANLSLTDRPVLYLTYACPWYRDVHNFPQDRYLFGPDAGSPEGWSKALRVERSAEYRSTSGSRSRT